MQEQKVLITFFGATGDLASRKLYPALFRLFQKDLSAIILRSLVQLVVNGRMNIFVKLL